ncbi:MAG: Flp pilus assembly protein CpaB [Chloroflexota bacterium]
MRRRKGGIILIVFGIFLAALVGGSVYFLAQGSTSANAEETTKAIKVVALVPERTLIPPTALEVVDVPAHLKPVTAVTDVGEAANKMALSALYPGDWVLTNRIADTKGQSGAAFALERGLVMVTFPGSDIVGTGAVRAGDTVDILVTIDTAKESPVVAGPGGQAAVSPGGTTQMTIQNLKIVNVGLMSQSKTDGAAAPSAAGKLDQLITFGVQRADALALKQVKDYPGAKIELVLRAAGDQQIYTTDAVNMKGLIDRFKIKAPQP